MVPEKQRENRRKTGINMEILLENVTMKSEKKLRERRVMGLRISE